MQSPFWVLVPIGLEVLWAVVWLPKAWKNLVDHSEDEPTKIKVQGAIADIWEMTIGLVLVVYHLPVLMPVMILWNRRRVPFGVIVFVMILTAGLYTSILFFLVEA